MQKKLIALAVASVVSAPAFAGVNVYGVVDAAALNRSITGFKSSLVAISSGLAGSRVGVVADEDLDNGMKAIAKVEYALDVTTAGGVGNARQEMLALAGGFGTVAAGYLQTAGYDWQAKFDPFAGSSVSPLQYMTGGLTADVAGTSTTIFAQPFMIGTAAGAKRAQHALAYISPDMGGVTVAVNYSTALDNDNLGTLTANPGTTGNKTTAMLLSATYAAGPLTVGAVYLGTANDNTGYNKVTDLAFGGSYDLGVAKLFGTYQTNKTDAAGATTNKALSLSVVAPVGPGAVAASYAKNTISTGNDDSGMSVAYLMGLSKTTTAYAALNKNTFKTANVSTDVTLLAVGVKKAF